MGFRPTLPDSLPVVGESKKCKNVYYAFGHQHLGLSLAMTGKVMRLLIEKKNTIKSLIGFKAFLMRHSKTSPSINYLKNIE